MSKNTVERTEGCHVVSFKADPTKAIPKGCAVHVYDDYTVTPATGTGATGYTQGVSLEAHASGVYDCIPVLLPGPVLRVLIGTGGVAPGNHVDGDQTVAGEWVVETGIPGGFALETAADGEECDIVFIGEQY